MTTRTARARYEGMGMAGKAWMSIQSGVLSASADRAAASGATMERKTIFDIGMHNGDDTDFYLAKGFHVVAVEANPVAIELCKTRFADALASGRLKIINKAISDSAGSIEFYVNDQQSVWGTADRQWMERNAKLGAKSHVIHVPATKMEDLLEEYGTPYYMKVDIEGFDRLCIAALVGCKERPTFVSIESHAWSYKSTVRDIELLRSLRYGQFKIVRQDMVTRQTPPVPPQEGKYVDYSFQPGSSGLFGEEAPGRWMSFEETLVSYRRIYRKVRIAGIHNGILRFKNRYARWLLGLVFTDGTGWFDTHAKKG